MSNYFERLLKTYDGAAEENCISRCLINLYENVSYSGAGEQQATLYDALGIVVATLSCATP